MFKYLWIIAVGIVVLLALVIAVIEVVTAFKENWEYYIKADRGSIFDVFEGTWDNIEDYVKVLISLIIGLLLMGSFVTFWISLGV